MFYFIKKNDAIYLLHAFQKKKHKKLSKNKLNLFLNESRRYEKAWKEVTAKELADSLGFDFSEVEEKQRLIDLIVIMK